MIQGIIIRVCLIDVRYELSSISYDGIFTTDARRTVGE